MRLIKKFILDWSTWLTETGLAATRPFLRVIYRRRYSPGSVLHVSVMVHTAYQAASLLRSQGVNAKYLAIGTSPLWNNADYVLKHSRWPFVNKWREFVIFWSVISRFEIVHSHFVLMPSETLWEFGELKAMGRKVVAHFRGCEARDREINMRLNPHINICQECDHADPICKQDLSVRRRAAAEAYADATLVTTPDMLDFYPHAEHVRFFTPVDGQKMFAGTASETSDKKRRFKIVHVTVHPGIEGTRHIQAAVDRLNSRGYNIDFVYLNWVPQEIIWRELADTDLAIGKMKMGYYANSQIESMMMGVPTITYVRDEFVTPALQESGLILAKLDELESVIQEYIDSPDKLRQKKAIARSSIIELHDNDAVCRQMINVYDRISPGFKRPTASWRRKLSAKNT